MNSKRLVTTVLLTCGLVAACDPTAAPGDAFQAGPQQFAPPAVDAGSAKDGGTSTDAGVKDGGTASDGGTSSDAGTPGLTIVSHGNKLPKPWVVTDATLLVHNQPLVGATAGLKHVGQVVQLSVSTTSDNTVVDDDHCPDIFSGTCDGFAAKDSTGNLVLVDTFVLLGSSGMSQCSSVFNASTLPQIGGLWVGRYLTASMLTSYSIALTSCAGVGQGTAYAGTTYAPASTDVQDLQAHYPTTSPTVTVRGVVTGVQSATTTKTVFIQDPGGGDYSGIQVFANSGYSTVPAVGDYVTVTGTAATRGDYNQLVLP